MGHRQRARSAPLGGPGVPRGADRHRTIVFSSLRPRARRRHARRHPKPCAEVSPESGPNRCCGWRTQTFEVQGSEGLYTNLLLVSGCAMAKQPGKPSQRKVKDKWKGKGGYNLIAPEQFNRQAIGG